MDPLIGSLIVIVFIVIAVNGVMLYFRYKKNFPQKSTKKILEEEEAAIIRDRMIHQKIDREQEDAERRVELQNKTLELYEQVRRNAEISGEAELEKAYMKNRDTKVGSKKDAVSSVLDLWYNNK